MDEYSAPHHLDIPTVDIVTYVFSSGSQEGRSTHRWIDADDPTRNYSIDEAEVYTKQVGLGLQKLGLQPDDKVLLCSGNQLHFPVLFWGVIAAGCVFTGCSPKASVTELAYQLKDSDAKLLLIDPTIAKKGLEAAELVGIPRNRMFSFCDVEGESAAENSGLPLWTDIWASTSEASAWQWRHLSTLSEVSSKSAVINYSSGTTGLPKGVEISHYNLVSNAAQVSFKRDMVGNGSTGQNRAARLASSGDRLLAQIPMFHAYGQTYFCINAAVTRSKVFIMREFTIDKYLLYMDLYRITYMTNIPAIMTMLSKVTNPQRFNFSAIEQVVSGSAPLSKQVARQVESLYLRPEVLVKQGWGMTECTCSGTGFAPDDGDDDGSVGWLNPNMKARIVTVEDRDFGKHARAVGNVGELWISGPNIMKGYYKKPEETRKTIVNEDGVRWLTTGDIGFFDSRGRLFLIDRLKELIKVNGLQVAPAELEAALQAREDVQDAVVVGHKVGDREFPRAYIIKTPGSKVTAAQINETIESRFSKYKWLKGGVVFIDDIPRTPSGKPIRKKLIELYETIGTAKL